MNEQRGMSMVELLVSLAVVLLILGAATTAYLKLLRTYKTEGRLAEGYMANLTGLEMLRYDVEMAGFGLPQTIAGVAYNEAVADGSLPYSPDALNDSSKSPPVPRAFAHLDDGNTTRNNSDVLAIKSSVAAVAGNTTNKKWSFITSAGFKKWGVTVPNSMDFTTSDRFIVLNTNGTLVTDSGNWNFLFSNDYFVGGTPSNIPAGLVPSGTIYYAYGIGSQVGMPFNRVDYYLDMEGQPPSSCAQNTYTLYRGTVNQSGGSMTGSNRSPLIDCVKDFQVAFGLDTDLDGNVDTWVKTLGNRTASDIRQQVREVRVFLLYQEGLGDTGSTPGFRFSGVLNLGDQDIANSLAPGTYPTVPNNFTQLSNAALGGSLKNFSPTASDLQYRWKILELAIKPMNLK